MEPARPILAERIMALLLKKPKKGDAEKKDDPPQPPAGRKDDDENDDHWNDDSRNWNWGSDDSYHGWGKSRSSSSDQKWNPSSQWKGDWHNSTWRTDTLDRRLRQTIVVLCTGVVDLSVRSLGLGRNAIFTTIFDAECRGDLLSRSDLALAKRWYDYAAEGLLRENLMGYDYENLETRMYGQGLLNGPSCLRSRRTIPYRGTKRHSSSIGGNIDALSQQLSAGFAEGQVVAPLCGGAADSNAQSSNTRKPGPWSW